VNLFRSRSRLRVVAALLALGLVAAACGADEDVAEVADESLTQDELVDLVGEPAGASAQVGDQVLTPDGLGELSDGTLDKQQAASLITSWVRNELWYAELAARGFEVTDEHFAAARADLETIALNDPSVPDLDTAFGAEIVRSQALPAVVAEYLLDVAQVEPAWPVQLCASHILLETQEEALAVIDRLDAGEDFAALAVELSTGPSGPNGGDLGCADPSGYVPEFSAGAALVEAPGISAPVETQFGWHVIEVRSFDATPSEDPAAIQQAVFSTEEFVGMQEAVFAREVVIDPVYGTWDTTTLSVVPADG
jgi:PPIC-type PPIASE domain